MDRGKMLLTQDEITFTDLGRVLAHGMFDFLWIQNITYHDDSDDCNYDGDADEDEIIFEPDEADIATKFAGSGDLVIRAQSIDLFRIDMARFDV